METIDTLLRRFEQLNDVGTALSQERRIEHLLERILLAAKAITGAEGGTLYRLTADGQALRFEIVHNDRLGIALGGASGQPISGKFHDLPLRLSDGTPNHQLVAAFAANTGRTVNVPDAYEAEGFDFSGTRRFDESTGYRSRSFLTVPMKNHEGDLIGVLQLLNVIEPASSTVQPFTAADQRLAESLASQAAVALTNQQLLQQLESLFESFIGLINAAIDEKSPYTGGHCQRVPELTMMLAEAVNETDTGPLAEVCMTEKDFHELRIAALLHDCGKVTTPVHVVDKATKLQTLHDRIHEIDVRFELVKREAELRHWQAVAASQSAAGGNADLANFLEQCDADRDFLRRANIGGERMSDEDVERVKHIATAYQWQGPDGTQRPLLHRDELENLSVRAGTLNAAEREVINQHISTTIRMLEHLPWPKHLLRVPEYAGGHHERMDGKGYPKGLTRDEMSWQARMMGIADIFEALTAADRPYKKAMPLSQALAIMRNFKEGGHIDPDLFDVFVSKQVYRRYAQAFLVPAQIDC